MEKVKLKAQPSCYRRHLSGTPCWRMQTDKRAPKGQKIVRARCIPFNDNEGHSLELKGHFCPRKVQDMERNLLDGSDEHVRSVERNRAAVQNKRRGEPPL